MQKKREIIFSDDLIRLLPKMQYRTMRESPKVYADEINRMNEIIVKMPKLYETDGKKVHPLSLHYFVGGCDWYIAEWDRQDQFFGYAILNGDYDNSEWGYISVSEILALEFPQKFLLVNLDLHCHYETVEEALFAKNKKHFWRYSPESPPDQKKKEDRYMAFGSSFEDPQFSEICDLHKEIEKEETRTASCQKEVNRLRMIVRRQSNLMEGLRLKKVEAGPLGSGRLIGDVMEEMWSKALDLDAEEFSFTFNSHKITIQKEGKEDDQFDR